MRVEPQGRITAGELNDLFAANDWQIDDLDFLEQSINNAWIYLTARADDGRLVGYVQVISDGIMLPYMLRMIVHPEFRRRGIARKIMCDLMEILKILKMKPTLAATPGNEKF